MFQKLSITACDYVTVRDLLRLKEEGHCVCRSSHAGNWNWYKLLLSQLGIPDCIWDVTCIYADVNNQPRHQLIRGEKLHLLEGNDPGVPSYAAKYLTPYHRTVSHGGQTLSNFHVEPLRKLFGEIITTQSEVLLQQEKNLERVFNVVERYRPEWIGRYILPCGCMVELKPFASGFRARCKHDVVEISRSALAESAMSTLEELKQLVFHSAEYEAKGGALYSFELVVASFYLWAYWEFGDKVIYELSGPDMIGYATKPDFIRRVAEVLRLVGQHLPELTPEKVEAKIVPATFFRFGYPEDSKVSKEVMLAHDAVVKIQEIKRKYKHLPETLGALNMVLKGILPTIEKSGKSWDLFHSPSRDAFFSQHDMLERQTKMQVLEGFLDVPFRVMGEILRTLPQTEASLLSNPCSSPSSPLVYPERVQSAFGPTEDSFR